MKVVIVGGTHGNEKSGIFLIQKFLKHQELLPRGHAYKFCIGNPLATRSHCRYLDHDLNRSFGKPLVPKSSREGARAAELKADIEAWAQGEPFFLIDFHTSTANMGTALVLSRKDRLSAHAVAGAITEIPQGRVVFNTEANKGQSFLESLAPHGVLLEVGPVSQNVFDPDGIQKTEVALIAILKTLQKLEARTLEPIALEGFQEKGTYPYPTDQEGRVSAYLHPRFFGRDYEKVENGDPIFVSDDGTDILFDGEDGVHPIFIGEAAYLESATAFMISKKVTQRF